MWEPRITVTSVEAEIGDDDGEVLLDISYTIISTNDERNLVFPFYIIPAEEE
jgi:phage baseplate assembly protein W